MITPVNPFPVDNRVYSNITPFTVRDNATVIGVIEEMRKYLNSTLVPFINENVTGLGEKWVEEVNRLKELWEEQTVSLLESVNAIAEGLGDAVENAKAAEQAAKDAAETAEQFASQVQAIQDSAITAIFNDFNSSFRQMFNQIVDEFIIEDPSDEGMFITNLPTAPETPESGVSPDPNDPGFFV